MAKTDGLALISFDQKSELTVAGQRRTFCPAILDGQGAGHRTSSGLPEKEQVMSGRVSLNLQAERVMRVKRV